MGAEEEGVDSNGGARSLTVDEGVGGGGAVVLPLVRDAAAGIEGGLLLRLERLAHVAVVAARVPEVLQGDTQRQQRESFDELAVAEW